MAVVSQMRMSQRALGPARRFLPARRLGRAARLGSRHLLMLKDGRTRTSHRWASRILGQLPWSIGFHDALLGLALLGATVELALLVMSAETCPTRGLTRLLLEAAAQGAVEPQSPSHTLLTSIEVPPEEPGGRKTWRQ